MFISVTAASLSFVASARALDTTLVNEASWQYVTDAIGACTDYATSIPKAHNDEPFIQIRVLHTLVQDRCKFTLAIGNKVTSCFVSPEQRADIQENGKKVIGRLLNDTTTCGAKAEQALLAAAPESIDIPRLAPKEVEIAPASGSEQKSKSLAARLKAKLFETDDVLSTSEKQ